MKSLRLMNRDNGESNHYSYHKENKIDHIIQKYFMSRKSVVTG